VACSFSSGAQPIKGLRSTTRGGKQPPDAQFQRRVVEASGGEPGVPSIHDLRKTFTSLLAQRGVPTAVTQRLLEHSTPQLTNDVYTNVDPVLREAVNLLPVTEWV
jgi:integrase